MKAAAFLGKWFAVSVAVWAAMFLIIAALLFMAGLFQNMNELLPFLLDRGTLAGAVIFGLIIMVVIEATKIKEEI